MTTGPPIAAPDPARRVGTEARKTYAAKLRDGFIETYLSGAAILDIGYKGYEEDVVPIVPQAVGIDLGYPGYDGRTLPVADNSQDAVFSSHCLEHIDDPRATICEWFRVLKIGGYLIIVVPHQYLYERRLALPSTWNPDHRRFYTPATLLREIEQTLEPNSYRIRQLADNDSDYDYSVTLEHHPCGCYEIELVVEKIQLPSWQLHIDDPGLKQTAMNRASGSLPSRTAGNHRVELCSEPTGARLALYDFRLDRSSRRRVLVLKLDHRGDFLIGLPALEKLRATFADDHITLVCGSWNAATARDLAVADEIRTYDYFPENSQNWSGEGVESVNRFREVCSGRFDIAIDLRVDEDTRPLLRHVDAALRCGIGSRTRHPYLNIVLPGEFESRDRHTNGTGALLLDPDKFHSRMPVRHAFFHETDFSVTDAHLIYGPYVHLPLGTLRAEFAFQLFRRTLRRPKMEIVFEVARGFEIVALKRFRRAPDRRLNTVEFEFSNNDPGARYEFRIYVGGHPRRVRLRFYGVRVQVLEEERQSARFLSAELHIGEQLSLLAQLIAERVRPLYAADLAGRMTNGADGEPAALAEMPDSARCVVLAPLSNSTVRDWPLDRYTRLIEMLLSQSDCYVVLVGSRDQASQLSQICRRQRDDRRLINLGGRTDWSGLAAVLRRADLVIANNSGVAHLAAACGRPTLAIYSGSHQPQEWGPRGENVRAIMAAVSCSPCGYERLELCPHDHLCMRLIEPESVFHHAVAMLSTRTEQPGPA